MSSLLRPLVFLLVLCPCIAAAGQTPAQVDSSFDSDGVMIHYVVTGPQDAEPVVLIHGFCGHIGEPWSAISATLAKSYRVIELDCRGHGRSGKPHEPASYGVEMAKDVARLLDHLKIRQAHVAGYSMGAVIALNLAARFPDRLLSVTLGGSGAPQPDVQKKMLAMAESLESGQGLGPVLEVLVPKGKLTPQMIKMTNDLILAHNDAKALAACIRGCADPERGLILSDQQIAGIKSPMLALIGEQDPCRPGVDAVQKLLPALRVVVIASSDHMSAWRRPEFLREFRAFVDAHHADK